SMRWLSIGSYEALHSALTSVSRWSDRLLWGATCIRLTHTSALPQSMRLVPSDPKDLAVFAITPVAIALIDYASGYGKTYLLEP
ncbi:MAG: hypothetical protein ACR2P1_18405, partial [Pseudomonadales bacterium]